MPTTTSSAKPMLATDRLDRALELETIVPIQQVRRLPSWIVVLTTPLFLLLLWWLVTETGLVRAQALPSPLHLIETAVEMTAEGELGEAIAVSFRRAILGTALGAGVGLALGLFSGLSRWGEDLVDAPMQMVRALPWAGMMPVFVIWFGIDEASKIALVALATVFPLYINTFTGIRGVDTRLVEATTTLGLSRAGRARHALLPGAMPGVFTGLRYALGSAWIALVFAEQVNATSGIGYLIASGREMLQTDEVMVALVIYALIGIFVDVIVRLLEKGTLRWRATYSGR